jgi:hypothetical protein
MIAKSLGYILTSNGRCWIRDLFGESNVVDITEQNVWCGNTANAYSVVQVVARPEGNELIVGTCAFIDGGPDNECSQHVSATRLYAINRRGMGC